MKITSAPKWSRTTGKNLTTEPEKGNVVGRKFRLTEKPAGSKEKRTEDSFTILALDPSLSNPNSFTFAQIKNEATGNVFWNRIQHSGAYLVPVNQK